MERYIIDLSTYKDLPDNACLGTVELAKLLKLSNTQVYRLEAEGKIPAHHNPNFDKPQSSWANKKIATRPEARKFWKLGVLRQWQKQVKENT